jgi:Polyketide cyclase / dehydrase and lipid transport
MATVELTITIDRPVADVYRVLTTPELTPSWSANAIEEHVTTPGPVGVGSRRRATVRRFGGGTTENEIEITELEPERRVAVRSIESLMPFIVVEVHAGRRRDPRRLALGLRAVRLAASVRRTAGPDVRACLSARSGAAQVDDGQRGALTATCRVRYAPLPEGA